MTKYVLIISILATLTFSVYCGSKNNRALKEQFQTLCNDFNKTGNFDFLKTDDCWEKVLPGDIYARYVKCTEKLKYSTADQAIKFCSNIDASIDLMRESAICTTDLLTQELNDKFVKCLEQKRNSQTSKSQ